MSNEHKGEIISLLKIARNDIIEALDFIIENDDIIELFDSDFEAIGEIKSLARKFLTNVVSYNEIPF